MTATEWFSVLVPGDGDPRHGVNGYTNLGCRCEDCRAAQRARQAQQRAARTERLKADPSSAAHGSVSTYINYGCRCVACGAAQRRYRQSRSA